MKVIEAEIERRAFYQRAKSFFKTMICKNINIDTNIIATDRGPFHTINLSLNNAMVKGRGYTPDEAMHDIISNLMSK